MLLLQHGWSFCTSKERALQKRKTKPVTAKKFQLRKTLLTKNTHAFAYPLIYYYGLGLVPV
jgi:hypothetical protein